MVISYHSGFIDRSGAESISGAVLNGNRLYFSLKKTTSSEVVWRVYCPKRRRMKTTVHVIENLLSTKLLDDLTVIKDLTVGITSFEGVGAHRIVYFKRSDEKVRVAKFTSADPNCPFDAAVSVSLLDAIKSSLADYHYCDCCPELKVENLTITGLTAIKPAQMLLLATNYEYVESGVRKKKSTILSMPFRVCSGVLTVSTAIKIAATYDLMEVLTCAKVCGKLARQAVITGLTYQPTTGCIFISIGYRLYEEGLEEEDTPVEIGSGGFLGVTHWCCGPQRLSYLLEIIRNRKCSSCRIPFTFHLYPTALTNLGSELMVTMPGETGRMWYEIFDPINDADENDLCDG